MAKLFGKFSKISERKIQNINLIVIYWQYMKYDMPLFEIYLFFMKKLT